MLQIYKLFHQMISLDDTILHRECGIFHTEIIRHCVDTGFNGILCKYDMVLVLLFAGNSEPSHPFVFLGFPLFEFSQYFWIFLVSHFFILSLYLFFHILFFFFFFFHDFPCTLFFNILFYFPDILDVCTFHIMVAVQDCPDTLFFF